MQSDGIMVFLRNVFILFNVEKHLSDSAVVIGVVMRIQIRLTVSLSVSWRLFSMKSRIRIVSHTYETKSQTVELNVHISRNIISLQADHIKKKYGKTRTAYC